MNKLLTPKTSRRSVLAGAAGTAAFAAAGRPARAQPGRITFAFAPDDSGAIQELIDGFNAQAQDVEVVWREMDRLTDAFLRELQSDFMAGAQDIDVFGADVVWTAEMAAQSQVADLTDFTDDAHPRGTFVDAAARSVLYRNRVRGVPGYTDAGMLYYRRDLLEQASFAEPSTTWDRLAEMAAAVQEAAGIAHGFVFQGGSYEGGVTNALEYIWSAGGRPWTGQVMVAGALGMGQAIRGPDVITLDSADTVAGLSRARKFVEDGVAPAEATDMREQECVEAFGAGDAVFMRNWPFVYVVLTGEGSALSSEQIGVAPILTLREGGTPYSCLGGWNFVIPAASPNKAAAMEFIRYVTQLERHRPWPHRRPPSPPPSWP